MTAAPRILHYPGSKWSMAEWIISHIPPHTTYLEPFFGSGAVFFNKGPSQIETINDLDGEVVNLFQIIRDRPEELSHLIKWTPYSRAEYNASYQPADTELERARRFLVRCWFARGVKTSDRTGWRHVIDYESRPMCPAKEWTRVPEKIMDVTERLKGIQIENEPAVKLIKRYKNSTVCVYLDPPYILETRSNRMYRHEMKIEDHEELLQTAMDHPGPVLISGYAHSLYDKVLKEWRRETFAAVAEAGQARTEVLWINPIAAEHAGKQLVLF